MAKARKVKKMKKAIFIFKEKARHAIILTSAPPRYANFDRINKQIKVDDSAIIAQGKSLSSVFINADIKTIT